MFESFNVPMCTAYAMNTCTETIGKLAFVIKVYSRNIPGICRFLVYHDVGHIPGIYHTYDTMQIPDESVPGDSDQTIYHFNNFIRGYLELLLIP